jgi:hypothetical protein
LNCKKVANVVNCDYNDKVDLTEKVLVFIFNMFPNSHLGLIKSYSCVYTKAWNLEIAGLTMWPSSFRLKLGKSMNILSWKYLKGTPTNCTLGLLTDITLECFDMLMTRHGVWILYWIFWMLIINNIRHGASMHLRYKKREYITDKINELAKNSKNKNIETCIQE